MKTLLFTIALFTTLITTTFAAEVKYLTKTEYISLMKQNTIEYEEVTPGMMIEYADTMTVHTDAVLTAVCAQAGQDTVMATNLTHYLVYRKLTMNTDCGSYKKDETIEFLSWRKIRTVEQEGAFITDELRNEKITQLNDNTILITGTAIGYETTEDVPYKKIIRLGVSQFSATDHLEDGNYRYILFWASEVDTAKINISHLLYRNQN